MGAVDADFVEASNSERVCEILLNLSVNVIRKVITYTVAISQINFFFHSEFNAVILYLNSNKVLEASKYTAFCILVLSNHNFFEGKRRKVFEF